MILLFPSFSFSSLGLYFTFSINLGTSILTSDRSKFIYLNLIRDIKQEELKPRPSCLIFGDIDRQSVWWKQIKLKSLPSSVISPVTYKCATLFQEKKFMLSPGHQVGPVSRVTPILLAWDWFKRWTRDLCP